MAKWILVTWVLMVVAVLQGCLVVYNGEKVIRRDEVKNDMAFASDAASEVFHQKFKETKRSCVHSSYGSEQLVIPFITCTNVEMKLSESACYNDALAAADSDGDCMITETEARIYRDCW